FGLRRHRLDGARLSGAVLARVLRVTITGQGWLLGWGLAWGCFGVSGTSLGGGRVVPSRSRTGPTGTLGPPGDGGGLAAGVGVGGAGWIMVVPKCGDVWWAGSMRSARP